MPQAFNLPAIRTTFRVLGRAWTSHAAHEAIAALGGPIKWVRPHVHPAELDSLFQMPLVFTLGPREEESGAT